MRALLGQSYYLRFDPKLWAAMRPYPPLGTLYAASVLRDSGHGVALFDAMLAESERGWDDALDRVRPDVAVLYEDSFNYLSKMCLLRMRQAALTMIDMAVARGCTVIIAGSDATDQPAVYLERGARFVIVGEGERTLADLVDRLDGRTTTPFEAISGLLFRDGRHGSGRPYPLPVARRRSRCAALPGLGPGRCRRVSRPMARAARGLLDESGHDARVPLSLQLVREADLGTAVSQPVPRERRR